MKFKGANGETRARISQIAYYLPEQVLDNAEIARLFPEWTPAAIEEKLGVRTRHIASPGETAADMAVKSGADVVRPRRVQSVRDRFPDFVHAEPRLFPSRLGLPHSREARHCTAGRNLRFQHRLFRFHLWTGDC